MTRAGQNGWWFGLRAYGHHLVEAAVISQKLDAPVKMVYTHEDDMTYWISGILAFRFSVGIG